MSSLPPDESDFMKNRRHLNQWFNNSQNMKNANKVAYHTIWVMSEKMERDGNGLSGDHADALKNSLSSGKPICQVLKEENPHVVSGSGQGLVYSLGRMFHGGIKVVNDSLGSGAKPPGGSAE